MKNVLIVAQAITQDYLDVLTAALGSAIHVDVMTGSKISGNVICSPKHDPRSLRTRFECWFRHYRFVNRWMRKNRQKKYDLIFMVSNPPINSYIGLKLKKQFQAPVLYMNWDLYPQCIEYMIKNPIAQFICRLWHGWNSRNYPKIDKILTIGNIIAESINKDLKQKVDIGVIPIAVDTKQLKPIRKEENPFCREHGLTEDFVVLYSGKMGYGHNIELILEAAEKLKEHSKIRFVFIGEGPKYALAEQFVKEHGLNNTLLFPLQPEDVFPFSMACGDVGIVSQESSMAQLFMPSKTYSMMACGMAIVGICSGHDDLQQLISTSCCGEVIDRPDSDMLADVLLHVYQNRELLEKYQKNALHVVRNKYARNVVVRQYADMFRNYLR